MASIDPLAHGVARLALRTPTLPPATTTNTLIVGRRRLAVIEPATPEPAEQAALDAAIAARVDAGAEVVAILLTHHHGDHTAYAAGLRARFGGRILAHPATAARVDFTVDDDFGEGDRLELGDDVVLEGLHTPGHAPGHLVLHEHASGIAYAGDLVAGQGTILIDPEDDGDMAAYFASLARIAALPLSALVPAHGPVITDAAAHLQRTLEHRRKREAKVLSALVAGPCELSRLLAAVYDDAPCSLWPLAARSLEAHLQKLEREGSVLREEPAIHGDDGPGPIYHLLP